MEDASLMVKAVGKNKSVASQSFDIFSVWEFHFDSNSQKGKEDAKVMPY